MVNKKKSILFIVNPISGIGKQKIIEDLISKHLDKSLFDYRISYTEYVGHAIEISKSAAQSNSDIVVAVGGDGAVNELAKGIVDSKTIMGIIPAGSGNGLARFLKIPLNPVKAIKCINNLNTIKIDSVNINQNLFVSVAGVGFDALMAEKFATKKRRGFLTYIGLVVKEYAKYQPKKYKLSINNKHYEREALLICFANSNQFGNNFIISPEAKINNGMIDVCILKKIPLLKIVFLFPMFFANKIHKSKYIEIIRAKDIEVVCEKNDVINLDGESINISKNFNLKVNPQNLSVIVP